MYVSYVWSNTKLLLFPHWFSTLAVNARAISEILLNSHPKSAVCLMLSNKVYKNLIPIYGLHLGMHSIGPIGV